MLALESAFGAKRTCRERRRRINLTRLPSSPRGIPPRASHRSGLDTLASSGSCHRVKAAAFHSTSGSSRRRLIQHRLTRANGDGLPPSLHEHYTRFIATARQSAPLRRIGTFGLRAFLASAGWISERSISSNSTSNRGILAVLVLDRDRL